MNYQVYKIEVDGELRYWGYTSNLKQRQYKHNYLLKKDHKKELYNKIRELYPNTNGGYNIELKVIKWPGMDNMNKISAKRLECYLILSEWLISIQNNKDFKLWQKIPNISDR